MTCPPNLNDPCLVVWRPLFEKLEEAQTALLRAHPTLTLDDTPEPEDPDDMLAGVVLSFIQNLRAAAASYHRKRHLLAVSHLL